ncbi:3-ketoacyl-ACP reductase [Streptomyces camponoticapitis]|uniref:3-ketoacyl-ACP reductase n=1 Tax=Streptomyces camponoticapitis TaxID=1616125 RepID=A0ABQ2E001_9ACTN|nr:SDR family oxidoreductase [Streptomyces camponoticapitis]GGJ77049.1 3-ketoacyl-ACP reductase [Streptomyces camponoticapitis]
MTDLTGKTAVITGSARGIGKAIALRYAQLGANIVINYSSNAANGEQALKEVREHGVQAIAVQADISKAADVDRLFAQATQRFGSIDTVVANAGLELLGTPIADLSDEQIDNMVNVNARGALLTLQRAAKNTADNGRIIYIASTAIAHPVSGAGLYTATKAPGRYFAEVLAREVAERGITVNTIEPGPIDEAGVFIDSIPTDSPFRGLQAAGRIADRIGTPKDVADAAEYLAGDLAAWVSGTTLLITGGLPQ